MESSEIWNSKYIEAQYQKWKADPDSVTGDWQFFFKGFDAASVHPAGGEGVCTEDQALQQSRVEALIYRYRDLGHLMACMDPLSACPTDHPLLNLDAFGLTHDQLNTLFYTRRFSSANQASLKDIINQLKETYCRSIGVEYMHLQDPAERRWLQDRMEPVKNRPELNAAEKRTILKQLYQTELFEQFLNKKYPGQTRFSLAGADVVIPMLDTLFNRSAGSGCREIILGMAHRGRLSVQTQVLQKNIEDIFKEFESCYDPDEIIGAGDVKYHNGYMADIQTARGKDLRILLMNNPSHLESVNPVAEGVARARQEEIGPGGIDRVLPLLLHGDAAFAGQGIVAETLNMSQLEGFHTGGTIHLVINNQIGYTTGPDHARSSRYATDIAKMLMVPIFHVHGEDPEAAVQAVNLAVDYRWAYRKDVVIDLVCYRRYGHNEGDEPYYTQPQMVDRIRLRDPLYRVYADRLIQSEIISRESLEALGRPYGKQLEDAHARVNDHTCTLTEPGFYSGWDTLSGEYSHERVDTGVSGEKLKAMAEKLYSVPTDFSIYGKLDRLLKRRLKTVSAGTGIDWATAEALAFASLLAEGVPIRLCGQDSSRGTFAQRHSALMDIETGNRHIPLNHIGTEQAGFAVYDSLLSEAGVLGFEYGYALARPHTLTLWEAQFGDFVNNAQAVIDLYIASGESKWKRLNGLVLLLPHGYEGLGPEHSSARPERFLQLCAGNNLQVCNPTTPAQYFHLLRRQMKRPFRKPLVVLTPKSLLRHPMAISDLTQMDTGGFEEVLHETETITDPVRVLFCSGKIYYELCQLRSQRNEKRVAIVRIEQYYPFPDARIKEIISRYPDTREWFWVQEEPSNMGAWTFIRPRLENVLNTALHYAGRPAQASPATGFSNIHKKEQASILEQALTVFQRSGHGEPGLETTFKRSHHGS